MAIRVEFFGVARQRAGLSELSVPLAQCNATLGEVLAFAGSAVPGFGGILLEGSRLPSSITANLDGNRFVSDPETPIHDGQSLLILSADAGG